jgi:hypothetical protein
MHRASEDRFDAVFRILEEQHRISEQWPYTAGQIRRDKELSARLRELIDQLSSGGNAGNRAPRE